MNRHHYMVRMSNTGQRVLVSRHSPGVLLPDLWTFKDKLTNMEGLVVLVWAENENVAREQADRKRRGLLAQEGLWEFHRYDRVISRMKARGELTNAIE